MLKSQKEPIESRSFDTTADNYKLLKILSQSIYANVGNKPNDVRQVDAQVFAIKCFNHVTSALYLLKETKCSEMGVDILDSATIFVTTRAALESLLAFCYIFILPENTNDYELRHDAWVRSDLMERQSYEAHLDGHKEILAGDEVKIRELQNKILKNSKFLSSAKKDRIRILGGECRLKGWVQIAHDIKLEKSLIGSTYSFLCSYSHSGFLSIMQMRTAMIEGRKSPRLDSVPDLLAYITANMVKYQCKIF